MDNEWVQVDVAANDGFESAAGWSTVGQRRDPKRVKMCKAKKDTCQGFRALGTEYCVGHAKALGLVST